MTDLSSLLDRLKAATGPDRELDAALMLWEDNGLLWRKDDEGYWRCNRHGTHLNPIWVDASPVSDAPNFTASIDAALDLVERKLPGWSWTVCSEHTDYGQPWADCASPGFVRGDDECSNEQHEAAAPSPPLAILIALIEALIAEGK